MAIVSKADWPPPKGMSPNKISSATDADGMGFMVAAMLRLELAVHSQRSFLLARERSVEVKCRRPQRHTHIEIIRT
jgi:hypothetical protein